MSLANRVIFLTLQSSSKRTPAGPKSPISNLKSQISNLKSPIPNLKSPIQNLKSPIRSIPDPSIRSIPNVAETLLFLLLGRLKRVKVFLESFTVGLVSPARFGSNTRPSVPAFNHKESTECTFSSGESTIPQHRRR